MSKKTIIIILLALVAITGQAQTSFDPDEGCLNVIDISYAQGLGEYGDEGVSANYRHEKFINERLSIGAGIGYSKSKLFEKFNRNKHVGPLGFFYRLKMDVACELLLRSDMPVNRIGKEVGFDNHSQFTKLLKR